jgi:hypothetical protein
MYFFNYLLLSVKESISSQHTTSKSDAKMDRQALINGS